MNNIIKTLTITCLLLIIIILAQFSIKMHLQGYSTSYNSFKYKSKPIELVRKGQDGKNYYFSMGDTIPTTQYPFSHVAFFQGDPINLHSLIILENPDPDSISAIMGVVDCSGYTNHVLKITPGGANIQTTQADDSTQGATYFFTKHGMQFKKGYAEGYKSTYTLTNDRGLPGQVLMTSASSDTAKWEYIIRNSDRMGLKNFYTPAEAAESGLKKGDAYLITTKLLGTPVKLLAFIP